MLTIKKHEPLICSIYTPNTPNQFRLIKPRSSQTISHLLSFTKCHQITSTPPLQTVIMYTNRKAA